MKSKKWLNVKAHILQIVEFFFAQFLKLPWTLGTEVVSKYLLWAPFALLSPAECLLAKMYGLTGF